ncbi:MAG: hypothetical protein LH615_12855, partial [Ferruginibacter sp.]|nr:hypothetical protein [Ferruginibacter sp.]
QRSNFKMARRQRSKEIYFCKGKDDKCGGVAESFSRQRTQRFFAKNTRLNITYFPCVLCV